MQSGDVLRQRYKIIQSIGGGGFGDTYLALDHDFPDNRKCVVKHLAPKNSDPQAIAIATRLFKKEAQCLSRLGEHHNIPRLYAYFEEDGEFYLVQEFIEGHTLNSEFQPGKQWSEKETVDFLRELLEILAFVHQQGTIHRDVKPGNIMRADKDGKLFLIDFGAVKEKLSVDDSGQPTVVIGTPSYMPPEQATGNPKKSSDIYSVGILGIQALTGKAAHGLPRDEEELKQIIEELPIDTQIQYVLGRMVSFQHKNRFADGTEALQALIPTIVEPKPPKKTSNSPKIVLFTLLGAIALIGAGLYTLLPPKQPSYQALEVYLQNKEWSKADPETQRLLLEPTNY
ncbi:MAG: serine/threonine-protein kinase [Xenococcaceae cyanobacterium MO_167.B52]|nr:serine/threonine-protein kinase [Xenococcaceae cyanobacterium MO_167.B52]